METYPDYRAFEEEERYARDFFELNGRYPGNPEMNTEETVYPDEYFAALKSMDHPKHKAAMKIRAERLAKKDKSVPFVDNGQVNLVSYK